MSSTAFTIDIGAAFLAIFVAIPIFLLIGAGVATHYAIKYRKEWKKIRPNHTDVELREALGDRNGTGNILAAIRDAVQKAKDKEAEAKTKTEEAEKATKEKVEAEETIAKLVAGVASLSAKPATDAKQALTALESLATVSANALDVMVEQSPTFGETIQGVRDTGRQVKGLLDVTDKLTGRFILEKNKVTTAVNEKDAAERKVQALDEELAAANGRNTRIQKELDSLHESAITMATKSRTMIDKVFELVEAGKVGDQKKIATLQTQVKSLEAQITSDGKHFESLHKVHTDSMNTVIRAGEAASRQVSELARAVLNPGKGGNNNSGNNNSDKDKGSRTRDRNATTGANAPATAQPETKTAEPATAASAEEKSST